MPSQPVTGVPYRPGPVGRVVRLLLGLLTIQAAGGAVLAIVDGVSGPPDFDDRGLLIAFVIAAWLTPTVFDIGLGTSYGNRWRILAAAGIAASALAGAARGATGTGLAIGILAWIAVTLGWLGIAFLVAALLRTPGCEMRSLPHLASLVLPGDRVRRLPRAAPATRRVGSTNHRTSRAHVVDPMPFSS